MIEVDLSRTEDVTFKFPNTVGVVARELIAPKPDCAFGCFLNLSNWETHYFPEDPSIFSIDIPRLRGLVNLRDYSELSCGIVGDFSLPTFAIARESDSGAVFFAENQLLGTFRCFYEAQCVARRRIDKTLPVLPLGIVNVGNLVEFWACSPTTISGKVVFIAVRLIYP